MVVSSLLHILKNYREYPWLFIYLTQIIFSVWYVNIVNIVDNQNILLLKFLIKPIFVSLLNPLVFRVWDVDYVSSRKSILLEKRVFSYAFLCDAFGDVFLVTPQIPIMRTIGCICFIIGHALFIYGTLHNVNVHGEIFKNYYFYLELFFGLLIIMIILLFLGWTDENTISIEHVKMSILDEVGVFVYMLIALTLFSVYVSTPLSTSLCKLCHFVGIVGVCFNILSDIVLVFILFNPVMFRLLFHLPFLPTDMSVMITYYLGQFLLAISTRQFSCRHLHRLGRKRKNE